MEFRALGPLEVVHEGEPLSIGAAQQRALLAVLLLHRDSALAIDAIVDALWGEHPPATANKTVQTYVSRLRRELGAGVIVSEGRGYRLAIEPGQVDVVQFEQLAGEGRRALAAGDGERAREQLGTALGLWRGEPLADFTFESFAQPAITGLHEARLSALEDRIEADLLVGGDGVLVPEIESLIAAHPLRERLRGHLMLALYRDGRQADALAVYRQTSELLREELGLEPGPGLQRLERAILDHDQVLDGESGGAGSAEVCPFKGLAAFDRGDAGYFFGRERLAADLVGRLADSSLVGILGPSGIGKSSLLRAGVLSALGSGALPGSAGWRQLLIRPGEHPVAALADALEGRSLSAALRRLAPAERLVVAVDQLEELFTLGAADAERTAFLDQLAAAAHTADRRALVVVSLRADFYGRLAEHPRFAELLSAQHVLIGPMERLELRDAVECPAARAGLEVEPRLVDALISDVEGEPGGLPLLSTALLELWRGRDGAALRHESYRVGGGVRGAVARLAEAAYERLDQAERGIARGVMLRLAGGDGDAVVRRRVPRAELEQIAGAGRVVDKLTDARLLTVSDGVVELSHEALLREWPRYRSWLEEDHVGRRLHAHLMSSTREWEASGRDAGELYRGPRLAAALDWTAHHSHRLTAVEGEFLAASRAATERSTRRLRIALLAAGVLLAVAVAGGVVAVLGRQSARGAARVALARQIGAEAINEPRLDVAMLLAQEGVNLDRGPATESTLLATLQRDPSVLGAFAARTDLAPKLALSPDGRTLALSSSDPADFGQDSSCGCLGTVRFYDARTHARRGPPLTDFYGVQAPVYSDDGAVLVYPSDRTVPSLAVRRANTHALVTRLTVDPTQYGHGSVDLAHAQVLIAPDDRTVLCAFRTFTVDRVTARPLPGPTYLARWALPSGRRLSTARIGSGGVLALRLTARGTRLLVVDARRLTVFGARSLRRLRSVAIAPAPVAPSAAAISPGGQTVAIGSRSGGMSFVDTTTGASRAATGSGGGAVTEIAFSPTGSAAASTQVDGGAVIWNPQAARALRTLAAPAEQIEDVAFSPDGSTLYTSLVGGIVIARDLTGRRSFAQRVTLGGSTVRQNPVAPLAPPLAVSPDGHRFAVRLGADTVGIFSTRTLRRETSFTIRPPSTEITALAWSPIAPELAVGGSGGHVQLWQVAGTPREQHTLVGFSPIDGLPEAVEDLAFSPDGRQLAADLSSESLQAPGAGDIARYGNRLALLATWDAASGRLLGEPRDLGPGPARDVGALAFSPDGRLLAVSVPDVGANLTASVLVLDARTQRTLRVLHPLGANENGTVSLAFAPDGTLATGTAEGTLQLWNPTRGTAIAGPLTVAAGPVTSIAFDPSGARIVTTGGPQGSARLWFTASLQPEGSPFPTARGVPARGAFGDGGQNLLVVDRRGNAFAWPASVADWERRACAIAGRNLTRQEWRRLLVGQSYTHVCPGLG